MISLRSARPAAAAVLAFGVLGLSACGDSAAPPPSGPPPGAPGASNAPSSGGAPSSTGQSYKLGCTIPTFSHPFFVSMKNGLEDEAKQRGSEINVIDGKDDAQAQITAMDNFLVQKVDAIILCPTETKSLTQSVIKANGAKIPVISVNRTVEGAEVVTYVGADDVEGGRLQAQTLAKALPKGGNIVLLQGVLGSSPQRDREAGLEEVLKSHPELKIVSKVPYDFQRTKAAEKMDTILLQFPKGKVDAIVAQSDDGALAAADVCGQKGRTEIKLIGFNGESDAFEYIRQGKIHGTVLQDAETQGREAVKATIAHLKGESVKNPLITPLYAVTKENIDQYKPAWQSTKS
jgi:ribose transport system substrate-binding protein